MLDVSLSSTFDGDHYHLRPKEKVSYRSVCGRAPDCDECFARQVETRGACGRREKARVVRRINGVEGHDLRLCARHAELWKRRDDTDLERR